MQVHRVRKLPLRDCGSRRGWEGADAVVRRMMTKLGTTRRRIAFWPMLVGVVATPIAAQSTSDTIEIPTYEAHYRAEYRGHRLGSRIITVSYDAEDQRYVFESETRLRGILRFARPNPAVERTVFELDEGSIRPLEFDYTDGSRTGEDNVHILFDWDSGIAVDESRSSQVSLPAGTLNVGTILVKLMLDVSRGIPPGPYVHTDGESLGIYSYTAGDPESVEVEAGEFDTIVYEQQHGDSSRRTIYWLAPALGYLPIRIDQHTDGERRLSLTLESVTGLTSPRAELASD